MFPRRPKVVEVNDRHIFGKINQSLFAFSLRATRFGISTIAGLPLARNLQELGEDRAPIWMKIPAIEMHDVELRVDTINRHVTFDGDLETDLVVVSEEEIAEKVAYDSTLLTWNNLVQAMDTLRVEHDADRYLLRFGFNRGYQPVYFIIFES